MASCCVSREVWIHSLLAVPVVLHAVRASRSWRPRVARVLEARPHGQRLRACERAPLHPLQSAIRTDAPLHRSPVRAGKSTTATTSTTTRRRGDVARPPQWDTAMRPPESRNGFLLMAMWKDGVQTSRGGSAASVWAGRRAGGLASRHRVPVFREDGVRPKIGNHLHSSIWR